jgi:hypothetical protein
MVKNIQKKKIILKAIFLISDMFFSLKRGLDNNNYLGNLFEMILEGKIENKSTKEKFSNLTNLIGFQQNIKNQQNGVILFVPQDQIQMCLDNFPLSNQLKRTLEFAERSTKAGVPFVIVVTKVDMCEPSITSDPNNFQNFYKIQNMMRKTCEIFKTGNDRVFPLVNQSYVTGDREKHSLFKLVYRILDTLLINRRIDY